MNIFQRQLVFDDGRTLAEKYGGVPHAPSPRDISFEEFEREVKRVIRPPARKAK